MKQNQVFLAPSHWMIGKIAKARVSTFVTTLSAGQGACALRFFNVWQVCGVETLFPKLQGQVCCGVLVKPQLNWSLNCGLCTILASTGASSKRSRLLGRPSLNQTCRWCLVQVNPDRQDKTGRGRTAVHRTYTHRCCTCVSDSSRPTLAVMCNLRPAGQKVVKVAFARNLCTTCT